MKYHEPKLHFMNKSSIAYAVCVSGNQATIPSSCLTGVSASQSACSEGVHPGHNCSSGTLPGNECVSGAGDSEW